MRRLLTFAMWLALMAWSMPAATIGFDVSVVGVTGSGATLYRYVYSLTDVVLQINQEVDIRFDPALYGTLSNPVAPAGFDVLVLQPNIPPGAPGDYSALATVDNPSVSGIFSVDFTFLGSGTPGAQPFFINQFDQSGNFIRTTASGASTPAGAEPIPEPGSLLFAVAGLAVVLAKAVRPRRGAGSRP